MSSEKKVEGKTQENFMCNIIDISLIAVVCPVN